MRVVRYITINACHAYLVLLPWATIIRLLLLRQQQTDNELIYFYRRELRGILFDVGARCQYC